MAQNWHKWFSTAKTVDDVPFFITFFESPTRPPFEKNFIPNFGVARQKCTNFFYKKICEKNRNSEYMGLWVSREYFRRSPNIFFICIQCLSLRKIRKNQVWKIIVDVFFFIRNPFFSKIVNNAVLSARRRGKQQPKKINYWLYIFFSPT